VLAENACRIMCFVTFRLTHRYLYNMMNGMMRVIGGAMVSMEHVFHVLEVLP